MEHVNLINAQKVSTEQKEKKNAICVNHTLTPLRMALHANRINVTILNS